MQIGTIQGGNKPVFRMVLGTMIITDDMEASERGGWGNPGLRGSFELANSVFPQGCTMVDTAHADVDHRIAQPSHPITQGLQPWTLNTEGFLIDNARPGSDVLLTTNCPDSSRTIAWTHEHKKSRVLCYMMGHDAEDWNNPSYNIVLRRAIRWVTRRI